MSSARHIKTNHIGSSDIDLLRLVNSVSLACHKAVKLDIALRESLEIIAKSLGWPVGHIFYAKSDPTTDDVTLESSGIWYLADPKSHDEFQRVTSSFRPSAKGMPLAPQWREDVRKLDAFARGKDAKKPLNVGAAFNLPVVSQGRLVAVAEFFHSEAAERDEPLLEVASMLGHHLALAFEANADHGKTMSRVEEAAQREADGKINIVRELASGIAHEINNPLTIILGHLFLLRSIASSDAAPNPRVLDSMNTMEGAIKRIAGIVQSMRQFSQTMDAGEKVVVNASDLLHRALSLCSEHIQSRAPGTTVTTSGDENAPIIANEDQIIVALVEIIKNAVDAAREVNGGKISLTLQRAGERVWIKICDNGPGIPADIAARVMEPFFTTKEVGSGSGLGLPSAKGIIESHRGAMSFESTPGSTTFLIDLPSA